MFLPALVFEASVKIDVRSLIRDFVTLLLLVTLGVLMATLVTGYLVHWATGLPVLTALLKKEELIHGSRILCEMSSQERDEKT